MHCWLKRKMIQLTLKNLSCDPNMLPRYLPEKEEAFVHTKAYTGRFTAALSGNKPNVYQQVNE